jgi:plastocyanin
MNNYKNMRAKILTLVIIAFALLSCADTHNYPEEIVFDPNVSSTRTLLNLPVVFTDYSNGVVSRTWTFPSGTPDTSTEEQVEVRFSEVGINTCSIQNTFSDGITETQEFLIDVGSGLIVYAVSALQVEAGETITFTDNSGGVVSRLWTFPGGTPATSADKEVSVTFAQEQPITCTLEVTLANGISDSETIDIQIGTEQYVRSIFGFEDETEALAAWKTWISNGVATVMDFSIESSPAGGALDTNGYARIDINTANVEIQLFTKDNEDPYNAVLKSNTKYEFSFYVKSDDYTQFTAAETSNESATQAWKNFAWYSPVIEVDSEWSFKTVTFSTGDLTTLYPEGTANNVWTQFKFVQTTLGTLYIDEISLKEIQ